MKEEVEVLEKIANELREFNKKIEKSIEMAKETQKTVELRELNPFEEARQWMISALNGVMIDIAREFSVEVSSIDKNSIEYEEKLLKALKQIRAVINVREMIDKFFTKESLDEAIETLEKRIEWERKSSEEKTKEALEGIQKEKPVSNTEGSDSNGE